MVTEWDPCHDSVLAIGEQGWSFRKGDLIMGVSKDCFDFKTKLAVVVARSPLLENVVHFSEGSPSQ